MRQVSGFVYDSIGSYISRVSVDRLLAVDSGRMGLWLARPPRLFKWVDNLLQSFRFSGSSP